MDVERKQDIQFIRQFACKPLRQKEGLEIYYSILAVHFVLWKSNFYLVITHFKNSCNSNLYYT